MSFLPNNEKAAVTGFGRSFTERVDLAAQEEAPVENIMRKKKAEENGLHGPTGHKYQDSTKSVTWERTTHDNFLAELIATVAWLTFFSRPRKN